MEYEFIATIHSNIEPIMWSSRLTKIQPVDFYVNPIVLLINRLPMMLYSRASWAFFSPWAVRCFNCGTWSGYRASGSCTVCGCTPNGQGRVFSSNLVQLHFFWTKFLEEASQMVSESPIMMGNPFWVGRVIERPYFSTGIGCKDSQLSLTFRGFSQTYPDRV